MSKKKQKRSTSQILFWLMSLLLAGSMVISLVIVALPGPPSPTATPVPTWTPRPTLTPTDTPTPTPTPTHTPTATQAPIGPSLPEGTATPESGGTPIGPSPPTDTATPAAAAALRQTNAVAAAPAGAATMSSTFPAKPPVPFPTAAVPRLVFAVAGDSYKPSVFRQVLVAVEARDYEFLLHTGDLVTKGTEEQWQVYDEVMEGFDLPFYPVPGNHDGLDGELDGYLAHTGVPAHYSFDRGPVHFTMADSHNGGIGAAELEWLRQDLEATDRPVTIVVLHHPPFDPDGTDHIMAYGNQPFMALMDELDVDIVFAGHIHAYLQAERDGVRYYITGGAGSPLYSSDHPGAFHHHLSVTVVGEEVTVEVVKL